VKTGTSVKSTTVGENSSMHFKLKVPWWNIQETVSREYRRDPSLKTYIAEVLQQFVLKRMGIYR
jgi:hypothetical protein